MLVATQKPLELLSMRDHGTVHSTRLDAWRTNFLRILRVPQGVYVRDRSFSRNTKNLVRMNARNVHLHVEIAVPAFRPVNAHPFLRVNALGAMYKWKDPYVVNKES